MREKIIEEINKANANKQLKKESIESLRKKWSISSSKTPLETGISKIGGYPDLSKNVDYPSNNKHFFEFVCQINLSQLNTVDTGLPSSGLLSFFIWDDFKTANTPNKVIYESNINDLVSKQPLPEMKSKCESFEGRNNHSFLGLSLKENFSINQNSLDQLIETTESEYLESLYSTDQLYGHPVNWRISNSHWWAYLCKNRLESLVWLTSDFQIKKIIEKKINIYQYLSKGLDELIEKKKQTLTDNDNSSYIYSYYEEELENMLYTKENLKSFSDSILEHKQESEKWIHLLSLSSNYDAKIKFGDGKMEFYIHKSDLEKKDFSNIYCQIYN